jgi:DNA-directed RNA polymerase subunit omega
MSDPTMAALEARIRSRYRLVQVAALRAKQLNRGAKPLLECPSDNPLTIALYEIAAGKVSAQD